MLRSKYVLAKATGPVKYGKHALRSASQLGLDAHIRKMWTSLSKLSIEFNRDNGFRCKYGGKELKGPFFSLLSTEQDVDRLVEVADHFDKSFDLVHEILGEKTALNYLLIALA